MYKLLIDPIDKSKDEVEELKNYLNDKQWGWKSQEEKKVTDFEKENFNKSWNELEGLLRGKDLIK